MKFKNILILSILITFISIGDAVVAATYFVKPDGDDYKDGKSDGTAWATITKVNSFKFSVGDDVYFKCGGKWNNLLIISWSGTSENRVIIGAYYGSGTIGVSGAKPIFDGNNTIPSSEWTGLITINSATDGVVIDKYATVENIRIVNSEGEGIEVNFSNYVIIKNLDVDNTYESGIQFYNSDNGIIEGCDINNAGRIYWECPQGVAKCDWPSGINLMPYSGNNIVRKNTVHNIGGEGIGSYRKSDNNTIENNFVYENIRAGIYVENSRGCVVRQNLVYGSSNTPGFGIGLDDEPLRDGYTQDNIFFGNFIASLGHGIALWSSHPDSVVRNNKVFNNTIVDCKIGISLSTPAENTEIKNNIIWAISSGAELVSNTSVIPGITFDYNLWSSEPPVVGRGPHDPRYAPPNLARTKDWRALSGKNVVLSDFALQSGSAAINAGANLGSDYEYLLDAGINNLNQQLSITSTLENNFKPLKQSVQGNAWEIGADIYVESIITELSIPLNLRVIVVK